MLIESASFYVNIRKYIEVEVYQVNTHDVCAANKIESYKQHVWAWRSSDAKSLQVCMKVNNKFYEWDKEICESEEVVHVPVVRTKIHDCLGVILDITKKHQTSTGMAYYQEAMREEILDTVKPSS